MILIINAGSQTTKFKLFNEDLSPGPEGKVFMQDDKYLLRFGGSDKEITHDEFENPAGLIKNSISDEISKIGFRIVHGADKYIDPTELNETVISELESLNDLAPLHNPPALKRVRQFKEFFPDTPMYGVFDTGFHKTLPEKAFLYALPYEMYEKYGVRKYGFHGISKQSVLDELNKIDPGKSKVIICHLGGGSSITAVKDNQSVDTSMGFTPLEGLMMTTRSGDIDDGVIYYLNKKGLSLEEIFVIENNKSGLLGISGLTSDMRKLLEFEKEGNEKAKLAIEMYIYRVQKQIGAYVSALNGIDALIFTGGIGEGSDALRKRVCENLAFAGIEIDHAVNDNKIDVSENLKISTTTSKSVWVIPTDEELQIAKQISSL